ncbi:hypothetical protein LINPERHAP2_LOCUS39559 [Linum perenne]
MQQNNESSEAKKAELVVEDCGSVMEIESITTVDAFRGAGSICKNLIPCFNDCIEIGSGTGIKREKQTSIGSLNRQLHQPVIKSNNQLRRRREWIGSINQ